MNTCIICTRMGTNNETQVCDICTNHMSKGILLIEVDNEGKRTQKIFFVGEELFKIIAEKSTFLQRDLQRRVSFIPRKMIQLLGVERKPSATFFKV